MIFKSKITVYLAHNSVGWQLDDALGRVYLIFFVRIHNASCPPSVCSHGRRPGCVWFSKGVAVVHATSRRPARQLFRTLARTRW